MKRFIPTTFILFCLLFVFSDASSQIMPRKYAFFELFTNTPCAICGSQNPGFFERLADYPDQYHLISFYPGQPYLSCIFYQANKDENESRLDFYSGQIFGSPTVIINGTESNNPNGVTNTVLQNLTGDETWLQIAVEEEGATNRMVTIQLDDFSNNSNDNPILFAVVVEREVMYNAPNGETLHHNVFRQFLTPTAGVEVDISSGSAVQNFQYDIDSNWDLNETYVVSWAMESGSKSIINSGTRFDNVISSTKKITYLDHVVVYPNPTDGELYIESQENLSSANIRIVDFLGRNILREQSEINGNGFTLNTSNLERGIYRLEIESERKFFFTTIQILR